MQSPSPSHRVIATAIAVTEPSPLFTSTGVLCHEVLVQLGAPGAGSRCGGVACSSLERKAVSEARGERRLTRDLTRSHE